MPRRLRLPLVILLAGLGSAGLAGAASAGVPAWTTYRHDAARSGIDPDSAHPVTPVQAWQTEGLDGELYGQPLVYGAHVYVATENDTVYELNSVTGAVVWSRHLGTPEPSSDAPCGNISPSIGITSTPVIDPAANRIYAVGAVLRSGAVHHELFALNLSSGKEASGFPVMVDPTYPSGGSAVNQLQRTGLALDHGRVLIGYGGNAGDCNTYWGWLVSAPATGQGALDSFKVDPDYRAGAIWGSGNSPPIDSSGNVLIATGNGIGNSSSDPEYGDAVVKLSPLSAVLGWWAPTNWRALDSSDLDLGSGMPALLPAGYLVEVGKDGSAYLLGDANLGHVSSPIHQLSGYCSGGSWGGSVYEPVNRTLYTACSSGLAAAAVGSGQPPSLVSKSGFSTSSSATGPPMIAGGRVWATHWRSATLFGLDMSSGATRSDLPIPEAGSEVNHFSVPSAGGGRLFVASGDQVTAFRIALAPPKSRTTTSLHSSSNPAHVSRAVTLSASVTPSPDAGSISFHRGSEIIPGCSRIPVSAATAGRAVCRRAFTSRGRRRLTATYSGDAFYTNSRSAVLVESVVR
jgi:polyvinyl alcohol dehydrogenase (cytochrome)